MTTQIAREETHCRQGIFYMHHPTDRMTHTTAFVTPVVEHWLEREIAQCVHHEESIRRPIALRYILLPNLNEHE